MKKQMKMQLILPALLVFSVSAQANVVAGGHQNFNTNPSGLDFVTVHSSETLKTGVFNFGFFLNHAVNTLPYWNSEAQGRTRYNDSLLGVDLNLGLGLTDKLEVAVSAPMIVRQTVEASDSQHGFFEKRGNTLIRLATKYRLLGDDRGGFAVIGSLNFDRTTDNPYTGVDPGLMPTLEFAADTTVRTWALGANIGYRWMNPGRPVAGSPIQPTDDQVIGSVAASRHLPQLDTKIIFEVFGSQPARNRTENADRQASSLEFLTGFKHDWNHHLALHAGGGTELLHGVSSPDWRAYVGLNYTFGPVFGRTPSLQPQPARASEERFVVRDIQFEFDSDLITADSAPVLSEVAARLKKATFKRLEIVGHTDSIGNERYNRQLSLKRAESIRRYLVEEAGMPGDRIDALGKGEQDAIADNGNFQGRQQNRRVEFILMK